MRVVLNPATWALGLALTLPAAAPAQQACEVDEGRPSQVARATLAVQMASGAQDPAAAAKQLSSAVRMLTERGEQMANQVGRNYVLGKALVLWSMQPNVPLVTTRGPLGFTTNPQGTIDLAAAIDSSFRVVETAHPECIAETSRWRGQKPWVDVVNGAIERLQAEDVDSAHTLAQRAIQLNPYAPFGYVVMANVMQKRGNATDAFRLYRQAVEAAARDTSYNDVRRQSLIFLGNLAADSAEIVTDAAARTPYLDVARRAFQEVLADTGAGELLSSARAGLCRVAIVTGDTAQLRATYRDPLANPGSFSYADVMNAGVCMARAEMVPEATILFRGAYEKNPWHRDALSNLSIMLLRRDEFDRALPLAIRLESVEPNNPENLQLLVMSYAGIATRASHARRGTRTAPSTKAGGRPAAAPRVSAAVADSLFKIEQAYTDSAVKANERKENLRYRVSLSDFTYNQERATMAGSVTNTGTEVKPVAISVDFLDREGQVVQSKSQDLGAIAPGSSARFNITVTPGTNVTAFRYKKIE